LIAARNSKQHRASCKSEVTLIWEGHREKSGRLLGRIIMPDGQDMAKAIVKAGYAVNY
jgi:endonuclease YncB( thermonuclease family)